MVGQSQASRTAAMTQEGSSSGTAHQASSGDAGNQPDPNQAGASLEPIPMMQWWIEELWQQTELLQEEAQLLTESVELS